MQSSKFKLFDTLSHAHTLKLYTVQQVPAPDSYLYDGRSYYIVVGDDNISHAIPQAEVEDGTFVLEASCKHCKLAAFVLIMFPTLIVALGTFFLWRFFAT